MNNPTDADRALTLPTPARTYEDGVRGAVYLAQEAVDVRTAAKDYIATAKTLGGCSDGYCVITGKASGQHTNGGCKCGVYEGSRGINRLLQMAHSLALRALAQGGEE